MTYLYLYRALTRSPSLPLPSHPDALGDIFFYFGDRFLIPAACRQDPTWYLCKTQQELSHDSVYTQYTLEVDGSYGGCPSGARSCNKYAACNPIDAAGAEWRCRPSTSAMGMASIVDRYSAPKGRKAWDQWKYVSIGQAGPAPPTLAYMAALPHSSVQTSSPYLPFQPPTSHLCLH